MTKAKKIDGLHEVTFTEARRGAMAVELINNRRAFTIESGPDPLPGDRWKVRVVGMNKARTVYLIEPVELVEAADGLGDILRPFAPFFHEFIREAEFRLELLWAQGARAKTLKKAARKLARSCCLPDGYKSYLVNGFWAQHA
jgi:hypothetical protein